MSSIKNHSSIRKNIQTLTKLDYKTKSCYSQVTTILPI
nr:MAG TPA: hypothetical protein [Caudoviricetes sp.]